MSWWDRLLRRKPRLPERRGTVQDWVDAVIAAQEFGALRTTLSTLPDEETISTTLAATAKSNGPVFALMQARMMVFSEARFAWRRRQDGRPAGLFDTPELRVLHRPWAGGTTGDLLSRMDMDATIAGQAYVRRIRSLTSRVDRLVMLRPDWVTVILGSNEDADHPNEAADVQIIGYIFAPDHDRSKAVALLPEECAHYAPIPDPGARFLGMSWLTPVFREIAADNGATIHKDRIFRNAATVNLGVKFDNTMTRQQAEEWIELFESEHRGAVNAFKTVYLGGGADLTPIGMSFKDADFAQLQGKAESRLAAAAGVPPSWVGFSEGLQGSALNAGNFTAARRRFADGTIRPLWRNAAASLEAIMRVPGNAELWYDDRDIPFVREDGKDDAEIKQTESVALRALLDAGFDPDAAVEYMRTGDMAHLLGKHSGRFSIQLQTDEDNGSNGEDQQVLDGRQLQKMIEAQVVSNGHG